MGCRNCSPCRARLNRRIPENIGAAGTDREEAAERAVRACQCSQLVTPLDDVFGKIPPTPRPMSQCAGTSAATSCTGLARRWRQLDPPAEPLAVFLIE